MIPYGRQWIDDADIQAVVDTLRSDWLTQGPAVGKLEAALADLCHAPHAVAANSATSALHIACLAIDVGPGDVVWTVPNTFVASANCARLCGADVDFVDIDPTTYNISVPALEHKLRKAAMIAGRLPKAVIPVHFSGRAPDQEAIWTLAKDYGFRVIEDASHSVGATHQGEPVGSCRSSDIAVFSFHPVKIVTTAEGGLATTRDAALADRMARLRTHGITKDQQLMSNKDEGGWYYEQIELGLNYRLTDMQAALGLSQLRRLYEFLRRRRELVARYERLLADVPVTRPLIDVLEESAWHLYVIRIDPKRTGKTRRQVYDSMRAAGIGVQVHYIPVHLQPYYRALGFKPGDCPEAERYYEEALSLPLYPAMSNAEQDQVVDALKTSLRCA
ncbi:UDP-4-amino-4,6-dideoxy-N-acetyl-beta-L-altrosamine transaminase [Dongia deserti]|uniref:UDP-4-amino-4, 6-dideoxy-N-acetyl-beta-L-altrosamine transaminase n=1 Tax=Dongia deserti TaxID=2268030 RepID=UPI000E64E9D7|nr:UDP-4-amino-4,6-dideoxy-N-acetyl-beta-L-altrosamine transaminase [Dongia deserti]